jgi:hypothetical protein
MSFTHVSITEFISTSTYNTIQNTIAGALSLYGSDPTGGQITLGGNIVHSAGEWLPLYNDINRCVVHQTGGELPVAFSNTCTAYFVNLLGDSAYLAANNNVYNVASSQLLEVTTSSQRTLSWDNASTVHHTTTYDWRDTSKADYFFNLGGKITASISYLAGSYVGQNAAWVTLINNSVTNLLNYKIDRLNRNTVTYTRTEGVNTLTVTFTRNSAKSYTVNIAISTTGGQVTLPITGSVSHYISRGDLGGIGAPEPLYQNTVTFDGSSGSAGPYKSLYVSPTTLNDFIFSTDGSGATAQTITLSNYGNIDISVSAITPTLTGGVVAHIDTSGLGTFPVTLTAGIPGPSKSFTVYYTGANAGSYSNYIYVDSNADNARATIKTTQIISGFVLTPSSLTQTVLSPSTISQQFAITNAASYNDYSYSIVSGGTGFTVAKTQFGPTVTFNTNGLSNATYSITLKVTVNGFPALATATVILDIETRHIGEWISPRGPYNAVVGMSYDVVGGIRQLTIGLGRGGNGELELYQQSDPSTAINIESTLGINADPNPALGPPLYPGNDAGGRFWCQFMKGPGWGGYGVILSDYTSVYVGYQTIPVSRDYIKRSYKFNAKTTGNYSWSFCVDDNGWVEISTENGLYSTGGGTYGYPTRGSVPLTAGEHTLNIFVRNTGRPGQIAFLLTDDSDGSTAWSTLLPIRTAYQGWMEVYRIVLDQGAHAYQSADYIVKDGGMVFDSSNYGGLNYGSFFTGGSIFTVNDDGNGNLQISFGTKTSSAGSWDDPTLNEIPYLPYYYSEHNVTRYVNLEAMPATGVTQYFIGFTAPVAYVSNVVTFPKPYPKAKAIFGG